MPDLPPTTEQLAARLAELEKARNAPSLTDEEIQSIRKRFLTIQKAENAPDQVKEQSFEDWLFG